MNNRAFESLMKIAEIEGISREDGVTARKKAMMKWTEEFRVQKSIKQSIIKNNLKQEEVDFVKYHIVNLLSQELIEDCVEIDVGNNYVEATIRAFKS